MAKIWICPGSRSPTIWKVFSSIDDAYSYMVENPDEYTIRIGIEFSKNWIDEEYDTRATVRGCRVKVNRNV